MSRKVQIMGCVTVMVVALSLTAILYMLMPECDSCGRKFCFGGCDAGINAGDILPNDGTNLNAPKTNQNTVRLAETERADDGYLDSVYFIGDSRTVALQTAGISEERLFASNGLNHEHALTDKVVQISKNKLVTIPDALKITAPDIMIISFGINGAGYLDPDAFIEGYETMVDEMRASSPHSIVVLSSILPVSKEYEYSENGITNEKIDILNQRIYQLAKDKKLYYLAASEAMKNESNALKEEYSGDGLHYNTEGCQAIVDYVLSHAIYRK